MVCGSPKMDFWIRRYGQLNLRGFVPFERKEARVVGSGIPQGHFWG